MNHTDCWYFNALLYLPSLLLTECQSTTFTYNSSNTFSSSCYSRLILPIDAMSLMLVSFTPWPLYLRYQLSRTVCVFQSPFASFWQYKSLLPQIDMELMSLAVPACSPVTVLRLPQLNSSNGRTAWIFQIHLVAQRRSGRRQQQLLTCCFVQVFEFGTWNTSEKIGYKKFDFLFFFLCLRLNRK